jgi:hypothetical protein
LIFPGGLFRAVDKEQLSEIGNQLGGDDEEVRRQAGQRLIDIWA